MEGSSRTQVMAFPGELRTCGPETPAAQGPPRGLRIRTSQTTVHSAVPVTQLSLKHPPREGRPHGLRIRTSQTTVHSVFPVTQLSLKLGVLFKQ